MRLTVSLLLIPCVLLTQFATVPHTHGAGSESRTDHHSQPHFHFGQLNPLHTGREVARESVCPAPACPACIASAASASEADAPWDHDADAVYVDGPTTTERIKHNTCDAHQFSAQMTHLLPFDFLAHTHPRLPHHRDGIGATDSRPLYVRYLALLI